MFVNYQAREVDGTVVRQEDRRLLIKSKDLQFAPSTELEVVDDAVIWQVVNAAELRPATTSILWELQVRA